MPSFPFPLASVSEFSHSKIPPSSAAACEPTRLIQLSLPFLAPCRGWSIPRLIAALERKRGRGGGALLDEEDGDDEEDQFSRGVASGGGRAGARPGAIKKAASKGSGGARDYEEDDADGVKAARRKQIKLQS